VSRTGTGGGWLGFARAAGGTGGGAVEPFGRAGGGGGGPVGAFRRGASAVAEPEPETGPDAETGAETGPDAETGAGSATDAVAPVVLAALVDAGVAPVPAASMISDSIALRASEPGGGGGSVFCFLRGSGATTGAGSGSTVQPEARSAIRPFVASDKRRRVRSSSGTAPNDNMLDVLDG
jgi:hypothetical protein